MLTLRNPDPVSLLEDGPAAHLVNGLFTTLFTNGPFMPHGHCYLWTPGLLWLHVVSDALIVLAYFSIPITLVYFVSKRKDLRFGWMFVCFAVFIIACGTTHLLEIWNVWHANYWLSGGVKAITALASLPTAFLLTRLVAPALLLPGTADLERLNSALEREVVSRGAAEERVRKFNVELEQRVAERTTELHALNADLRRQVAERERAEEAARQSEDRFRHLADAMPQIVWSSQPDGKVDYHNGQWHTYTGIRETEQSEASWKRVVHPDDQDNLTRTWQHSLQTGQPFQVESRFRRAADGTFRWHLGRALPIRNAAGEIVRWFGTSTDIDDYKTLQEEKERLLVSERAARSQAERTNQLKDEFLSTLSHELRTPLNAIYGWAQILSGEDVPADVAAQGVTTIERNARAQRQIIDDLLDMSAIISGKVRMNVAPVDLVAAIQAAVETMRPAADAKTISLQTRLAAQLYPVSGDPNRLQQIFWNLLSNAIKFTPRGGSVQVELAQVNSHLEISVQDSGEGITPEFLPHVFDRFRQEDASTTRRHGGLGLGLAITKHLVELHGGAVRVQSEGPAKGTTFVVSLPLAAVRETPGAAASASDRTAGHAGAAARALLPGTLNLAGVKVLVVDDERDAGTLVKRILEGRGAQVRTAASASDALAAIASEKPDVLVSDIGMPGENGYDLIRRVRTLAPALGGNIPALALTAYARVEDRQKAVQAGFQMHIAKPAEAAELLTMVGSLAGITVAAD